jgi:hypothetical protein
MGRRSSGGLIKRRAPETSPETRRRVPNGCPPSHEREETCLQPTSGDRRFTPYEQQPRSFEAQKPSEIEKGGQMRMIMTAGLLCAALLLAVTAAVHADARGGVEPVASTDLRR